MTYLNYYNVVYVEPELEERGFSGGDLYSCPEFIIAKGNTNSGRWAATSLIVIYLPFCRIYSHKHVEEFLKLYKSTPELSMDNFVWKVLWEVMTQDMFKSILATYEKKGWEEGMKEIRSKFKGLLGI